MQSFIHPDDIQATGVVGNSLLTAMVKNERNKTFVVLYTSGKPDGSAYSLHTVEIDGKSLCDGEYSLSFTDAMIRLSQRAANNPNILLVD